MKPSDAVSEIEPVSLELVLEGERPVEAVGVEPERGVVDAGLGLEAGDRLPRRRPSCGTTRGD